MPKLDPATAEQLCDSCTETNDLALAVFVAQHGQAEVRHYASTDSTNNDMPLESNSVAPTPLSSEGSRPATLRRSNSALSVSGAVGTSQEEAAAVATCATDRRLGRMPSEPDERWDATLRAVAHGEEHPTSPLAASGLLQ